MSRKALNAEIARAVLHMLETEEIGLRPLKRGERSVLSYIEEAFDLKGATYETAREALIAYIEEASK